MTAVTTSLRRARVAVIGMFVVNGATYNSIVPRLPNIRDDLGLSNAALGTAIAAFPAAALLFGVLAGPLIARVGSGRAGAGVGLAGAVLLPAVALAPSWIALAAALFVLGLTDAWADAAMNAHGLRVQTGYGRSIVNGLHAVWSMAAVGAGLLGAAAAGLGVPLLVHLGAVAVVLVVVSVLAWRWALPGPEPEAEHEGLAEASPWRMRSASRPSKVLVTTSSVAPLVDTSKTSSIFVLGIAALLDKTKTSPGESRPEGDLW